MSAIKLIIPGDPKGQARPRATKIGGFIRMYDPKDCVDRKHTIAAFAIAAGVKPIEGPISLKVVAVFNRPKRLMRKRDSKERILATCKPDWDNVGKMVSDALNGVAYADDSQITLAHVSKFYAAIGEVAHTEITLDEADAEMSKDPKFRCKVCGQVGTVARCCGRDTREPLNDAAVKEVEAERQWRHAIDMWADGACDQLRQHGNDDAAGMFEAQERSDK